MIKYTEPTNLEGLITQISFRPAMFTGWHNFGEVASFIEGYVYAKKQILQSEDITILKDFGSWLSEKFAKPKNWSWSAILQDIYQNDEEVLQELPKLFDEFRKSR
jgi:hypothetical protein